MNKCYSCPIKATVNVLWLNLSTTVCVESSQWMGSMFTPKILSKHHPTLKVPGIWTSATSRCGDSTTYCPISTISSTLFRNVKKLLANVMKSRADAWESQCLASFAHRGRWNPGHPGALFLWGLAAVLRCDCNIRWTQTCAEHVLGSHDLEQFICAICCNQQIARLETLTSLEGRCKKLSAWCSMQMWAH